MESQSQEERKQKIRKITLIASGLGIIVVAIILASSYARDQAYNKALAPKVIQCLKEQKALVFTMGPTSDSWKKQQKLFYNLPELNQITVDCTLSPNSIKACKLHNFTSYPAWTKDGETIYGTYTPTQLWKLAKCQ